MRIQKDLSIVRIFILPSFLFHLLSLGSITILLICTLDSAKAFTIVNSSSPYGNLFLRKKEAERERHKIGYYVSLLCLVFSVPYFLLFFSGPF